MRIEIANKANDIALKWDSIASFGKSKAIKSFNVWFVLILFSRSLCSIFYLLVAKGSSLRLTFAAKFTVKPR